MSVELLEEHAEDAEELVVAWLAPLRRSGSAFRTGDTLPFTLVTHITGDENVDLGVADPVVSVHTLCDKTLGYVAARDEARKTHDRLALLARYRDTIILTDGRGATVDYLKVFESPVWKAYGDIGILRKVGRYTIGLSYVPAV